MKWLAKAKSFRRRPRFERLWFLPAWAMLGVCRLSVLFIPVRIVAPFIGTRDEAAWVPLLDPAGEARARAIGRTVIMAARYTPWKSNCFAQALAARVLLGLYGIPCGFFFGVCKSGDEMGAHAWVTAGRIAVTGGEGFGEFAVVGCFMPRSESRPTLSARPFPDWRHLRLRP